MPLALIVVAPAIGPASAIPRAPTFRVPLVDSVTPAVAVTRPDADKVENAPVFAELAPIGVASIAPPLISTFVITVLPEPLGVMVISLSDTVVMPRAAAAVRIGVVTVVNVPAAAAAAPMIVPSIAPASISTLLILTSPVPLGVMSMFPLLPSVMVMDPVVLLPVLSVRSKFPLLLSVAAPSSPTFTVSAAMTI